MRNEGFRVETEKGDGKKEKIASKWLKKALF